ncbi:DNA polymerase beta domain protein region [Methanocaldococcus vulcanius M7]|uniref:protein adenylyltransferase n=1 Tax=Methanocaldococcus vulcanius (strain ATCC 700851 / DSM 12094 / M7) TaxID=579137 RepID=C9RFB0_METVM|nr:nucleotidyltransferase family protein [Methanocaldococcus vulcanius]ACX72262.1 DNA polymerase beta domain protein region [Methanocaldococcus vulcanius M7]
MKTLSEIKEILRKHKKELKEKYKVKSIAIFGSYARNEQTEKSDIDILVEFYKTPDYIKFFELEDYLSDLLGVKVDLVIKGAIKNPYIKKSIEEDLIYV